MDVDLLPHGSSRKGLGGFRSSQDDMKIETEGSAWGKKVECPQELPKGTQS